MDRRRFTRGTGTYHCLMCHRLTRDTGDNGNVQLCPQCYEIAGVENEISDRGDPHGYLTAEITNLKQIAIKKGGHFE